MLPGRAVPCRRHNAVRRRKNVRSRPNINPKPRSSGENPREAVWTKSRKGNGLTRNANPVRMFDSPAKRAVNAVSTAGTCAHTWAAIWKRRDFPPQRPLVAQAKHNHRPTGWRGVDETDVRILRALGFTPFQQGVRGPDD